MNNWQLFAVIGVPSVITLIGMAQNNKRFKAIEKRIDGMDKRMDGMDRTIATTQGQISSNSFATLAVIKKRSTS